MKAQRDAFAAREVREGRGTAEFPEEEEEARGTAADSRSEAGRLSERGAEEEDAADLVARI